MGALIIVRGVDSSTSEALIACINEIRTEEAHSRRVLLLDSQLCEMVICMCCRRSECICVQNNCPRSALHIHIGCGYLLCRLCTVCAQITVITARQS